MLVHTIFWGIPYYAAECFKSTLKKNNFVFEGKISKSIWFIEAKTKLDIVQMHRYYKWKSSTRTKSQGTAKKKKKKKKKALNASFSRRGCE